MRILITVSLLLFAGAVADAAERRGPHAQAQLPYMYVPFTTVPAARTIRSPQSRHCDHGVWDENGKRCDDGATS